MPYAYGYARVSHFKQFEDGESVRAQHMRNEEFFKKELEASGVEFVETIDDDMNVSAYRVPFHKRPAGKKLIAKLKKGDHLIVDKVDRLWRSMKDFVTVMDYFEKKKITVHVVNFLGATIQNNTPMGQFMLKQFVLIAELESTMKSERIKEALAARRAAGTLSIYPFPPACVKVIEVPDNTRPGKFKYRWAWDIKERDMACYVVKMKDNMKWTVIMEDLQAYYQTLYPGNKPRSKRYFETLYWDETCYRFLNIKEADSIPRDKRERRAAARQYRGALTLRNERHTKGTTIQVEETKRVLY